MKKYSLSSILSKKVQKMLEKFNEEKLVKTSFKFNKHVNLLSVYQKNRNWIYSNTIKGKGIKPKFEVGDPYKNTAYPEVSGYYIPTLLNWGYRDLAIQYAKWLLQIQHKNGSWHDWSDIEPYVFDSGQILKGLIAIYPIMPEVEEAIIKCCDWIISLVEEDGRLQSPSTKFWTPGICTELIHLYCLSPLINAGNLFNKPKYKEYALKVLDYYKKNKMDELLDFHTLSHFYAYIIESLVDLGEIDIAKTAMEKIAKLQKKNGHIPAFKKVGWTCSTGLFQFAVIWYKLGEKEKADLTFDYACSLQTKHGGWLGSYGFRRAYLQNSEISWANKYFMDALRLKISAHFAKTVDKNTPTAGGTYPLSNYISESDGRVKLILNKIKEYDAKKILDAGCGLGRILKIIKKEMPDIEIFATDIAQDILNKLPEGISSKIGSLLNIPYEDEMFDFSMTTEALEHAIDIEHAISELSRVTKKGGYVLIIDKDILTKGAFELPPWEQWFDKENLKSIMENNGLKTSVITNIAHNDKDGSDGIYAAWFGEKL